MNTYKSVSALAAFTFAVITGSAKADVLAFTDFNGRIVDGNTASNLNWTLNGLEDPGDMSAFNATGGVQPIFDGTTQVQDLFAPGINTGNGNTFWTTSVAIKVASGSTVTLSDVTFNYWAISGGQVENVNRKSDFMVTLSDPSAAVVATVTVPDTNGGTGGGGGPAGQPLVTLTFESAIALSDPGTYTLEIKGGDFTDFDETGNHTAIDNLSINGTVTSGATFAITNISVDSESGTVALAFESILDQIYTIDYSIDLLEWSPVMNVGGSPEIVIGGEGETTIFTDMNPPAGGKVFYRIVDTGLQD